MKILKSEFMTFVESLNEREQQQIQEFFGDFNLNFSLSSREKKMFKDDFENAIMYLYTNGVSIKETLSRLALANLGGFYARSSVVWFPLDDAAKIYPVSMEHGRQQVFRIAVYLKQEVSPVLLQMALNFTIKRFPSFATTLKKGFFWHYLNGIKKHFYIEKERYYPCQPIKVSSTGSIPFRIMYHQNRISVEFFHVLTDATGAVVFLKALIREYLRLNGVSCPDNDDVWNVNDTPTMEEFENAFEKVEKAKNSSGFRQKIALQMNGRLSRKRPCRMLHFKMNADKLHQVAKSYKTTVSTYLLAQMFYACRSAIDLLDGDINIQVPVNMRKYYPSKTIGNFSMYCGIRLALDEINEKQDLIDKIGAQLIEKSAKEKMHEMITSASSIVGSIRYIPLVIKQPIAKMIYGFLGEKLYTTTFSNLGVIGMPKEILEHVESMDFCLGPQTTNRLACAMATVGNVATFTISKMTLDPAFEQKLYKLLSDDGILINVEGSDYYER